MWWLAKRLTRSSQSKAGNPTVRAMVRLMFVCFGLGLFWPLLWNALKAMPWGLWLIVGTGLTVRVVRWYWRRLP